MADGFQAATAAFSTIELAFKLYKEISTFISKVKRVEETANGLTSKAEELRIVLAHITLMLQFREKEFENEREKETWKVIERILKIWRLSMDRFESAMSELRVDSDGERNWLDNARWVLRHDRMSPIILGLEAEMSRRVALLSTQMQCLQLIMHSKTQTSNRETRNAIHHISVQLKSGLDVADATSPPETERQDPEDPSDDSADEETHGDVDNNSGPPRTSFTINGLEPGANDVISRELLHDVIKFYQADLFARLDTLLERKEYSLSNESLQTQPAETNILRALHRDVNQRSGSDGSTYLTRAVKKGRKIEVEELILKEDADVNYTDKEGRTPLLHAVMEGDGGMVDVLTNYGAKLDATHNSRPILQEAIERGSASIVSQLRKLGAKLDEPTMNGMRPLLYIIQRNPRVSAEVLKAFCCRGEDDAALPPPEMNVVDEKGLTAVHHAVLCGNEEAIEILLSNGADPNIGCEKGNTPLHSAVIQRNETALKKLLQHCNDANESSRVNVNAEDVCRRTPLVFSVRDKGFKFAKLLLEAGANVDKCIPLINDWNGLSPPMTKILKQYRRNSMPPSPSNGDSASIISSTSLVFTRNSTPPTVATVETSSLSSHFPGLRLRRRETR